MPGAVPSCRVVPLPDDQISLTALGREMTRWHFGPRYPRPFFYPLHGDGSVSLTRMGHPGDPSHDHHRSIWFGHEKVSGVNFWTDQTPARIRQLHWLAFSSRDEEAVMAVRLGWFDGHDPKELMIQDLVAALRPTRRNQDREWQLELQSTFTPTAEMLEFGRTNFGVLGVRVAESLSVHFGGGEITGSDGKTGEAALFGQPNRWMDYTGPVFQDDDGVTALEGITFHDHPSNPNHPAKWHVREDGWMGPSLCRDAPVVTTRANPLVLRYLLQTHAGKVDAERANEAFRDFAQRLPFIVERSKRPHRRFEVDRR